MGYENELKEKIRRKIEEADNVKLKIALVGQPGAGKSSLINKILGEKIFKVSPITDTTRDAESHEFGNMYITDLPGYGTSMFPIKQWVSRFNVADYDLYIFVFSGKLTDADGELFKYLEQWRKEREHPYFVVRNKCDTIWDDSRSEEELRSDIVKDVAGKSRLENLQVYFTSCKTGEGISNLSTALMQADIDSVKKGKMLAELKATCMADLFAKKKAALELVADSAMYSAFNGLNPVPGVDAAFDLGIVMKMTKDIRDIFDLEDQSTIEKYGPMLGSAGKAALEKVFEFTSKEALIKAVEEMAKKYIGKYITKYIPIMGQVVTCGLSYIMIDQLGKMYVDNCFEVAKGILEQNTKGIKF